MPRLQYLAGFIFAVVHQLIGVDWFVFLAEGGIDADLAEVAFHTEGACFVGDDRYDVGAECVVA